MADNFGEATKVLFDLCESSARMKNIEKSLSEMRAELADFSARMSKEGEKFRNNMERLNRLIGSHGQEEQK